MSYNNYKETVWAKQVDTDLHKALVFAQNCNTQYEGVVKNIGDTVKILGVGKPTVTTVTGTTDITLADAETVSDTSVNMIIDNVSHFNYLVGDIDKAQMRVNLMETLSGESTYVIADAIDSEIANLSKDVNAKLLWSSAKTDAASTNILGYLDEALQKLQENNVPANAPVSATVTPELGMLIKQALISADTDNSKLLEVGEIARYGNMKIKVSNNVAKDASGNTLVQVKTDKALALVIATTHSEPYRPEKKFADAIKGFTLWACKLVRPEEMIVMNIKKAS